MFTWLEPLQQAWKRFRHIRSSARLPVDLPVTLTRLDTSEVLHEKLENWSSDGILILTHEVVPIETLVDLEFAPQPSAGPSLRLRGQVVRHHSDLKTGDFLGLGIMFTDYTQSGLFILRDLLGKMGTTEEEDKEN